MDTCIAIIMFCQRLFLLFTGKKNFVNIFFFSGDLPETNISLPAKFQVWWCYGFWQYSSSTRLSGRRREEDEEELEKTCLSVFP